MAKSIRSKSKRKMRAIKRERYEKKELVRLKKILGKTEDEIKKEHDVEFVTVESLKTKEPITLAEIEEEEEKEKSMDIDVKLKDNRFPVWMSNRKIKKIRKAEFKKKKILLKKQKIEDKKKKRRG